LSQTYLGSFGDLLHRHIAALNEWCKSFLLQLHIANHEDSPDRIPGRMSHSCKIWLHRGHPRTQATVFAAAFRTQQTPELNKIWIDIGAKNEAEVRQLIGLEDCNVSASRFPASKRSYRRAGAGQQGRAVCVLGNLSAMYRSRLRNTAACRQHRAGTDRFTWRQYGRTKGLAGRGHCHRYGPGYR
jgi:hypothetical protein